MQFGRYFKKLYQSIVGYFRSGFKSDRSLQTDISGRRDSEEDLGEIIDRIINAHICTREIIEQMKQTRTMQELNSLGYRFIEGHPMLAYDIFKRAGDEKGRKKVLREKFFESRNRMEQTYLAICKDEGNDTLREFGYVLLEKGNPELACYVFREVDDVAGLEKALTQIEKNNPKKAERLRKDYGFVRT